MTNYLIIIRYDPERDAWVVDEDSRHILEDDGGGLTPMELQVSVIRSLPQSTSWLRKDEPDTSKAVGWGSFWLRDSTGLPHYEEQYALGPPKTDEEDNDDNQND